MGHGGIAHGRTGDGHLAVDDSARLAGTRGRQARSRRTGRAGRAAAGNAPRSSTRRCCAIWTRWWSRRRPAIPTRRCAGPARVSARWRSRCRPWATQVSHTVVAELLHELGLQPARQRQDARRPAASRSGCAVSLHRATRCGRRSGEQQPTISVDTKKKELVGDFKNGGRAWRPARTPPARARPRLPHSRLPASGKAIPYGVYDLRRNEGWVSVGHRSRHRQLRGAMRFAGGGSGWGGRRIRGARRW